MHHKKHLTWWTWYIKIVPSPLTFMHCDPAGICQLLLGCSAFCFLWKSWRAPFCFCFFLSQAGLHFPHWSTTIWEMSCPDQPTQGSPVAPCELNGVAAPGSPGWSGWTYLSLTMAAWQGVPIPCCRTGWPLGVAPCTPPILRPQLFVQANKIRNWLDPVIAQLTQQTEQYQQPQQTQCHSSGLFVWADKLKHGICLCQHCRSSRSGEKPTKFVWCQTAQWKKT